MDTENSFICVNQVLPQARCYHNSLKVSIKLLGPSRTFSSSSSVKFFGAGAIFLIKLALHMFGAKYEISRLNCRSLGEVKVKVPL
jgi:hypothetical protein